MMRSTVPVLGPYEALAAEFMWITECMPAARRGYGDIYLGHGDIPSVAASVKSDLLLAYVLHGELDTTAALPYMDAGVRREWEQEVLSDLQATSPLRRETYANAIHGFLPSEVADVDGTRRIGLGALIDARADAVSVPLPVQHAVLKTLKFAGYQSVDGMSVEAYLASEFEKWAWPPILTIPGSIPFLTIAATGAQDIYTALDKSMRERVPLLSQDCVGPAWIVSDPAHDPEFFLLQLVLEAPIGPTMPSTFAEARVIAADPRVAGLHLYVQEMAARFAGLTESDLDSIRRDLASGTALRHRRRRAARGAQVVTYLAVPVGLAEAVTGTVGPGVGLSVVGAVSETVAIMMRKRERSHWTSM